MMEKFNFTSIAGDKIVLPRFENLPVGVIRRIRKLDATDQIFTLIEEIAAEQLDTLDVMDRAEFEAFITAWREGSAVSLGESSAS